MKNLKYHKDKFKPQQAQMLFFTYQLLYLLKIAKKNRKFDSNSANAAQNHITLNMLFYILR